MTPWHPEPVTSVRDSEQDAWWLPNREWMDTWLEGARSYWPLVLSDYREAVARFYADEARDSPSHFPLLKPTRVIVVVSLLKAWIFATEADGGADEVDIRELWEDSTLANWDILQVPNEDRVVRRVAGLSGDLELLETENVQELAATTQGHLSSEAWTSKRVPAFGLVGWALAKHHDFTRELSADLAALNGYAMDHGRLRELLLELDQLDAMTNPNARGLALEDFLRELLMAHGFEVEKGKHREGEQIDLIVHRPIRALIECRWYTNKVNRNAITELIGKLTRDRPAIVSGIYVSMSGFSEPAYKEAQEHARDRVVVLLDRQDVLKILRGEQHARTLIDERVDAIVRRFDA